MGRIGNAKPMFVREKTVNGYTYLYLVESRARERAHQAAHHP